MARSRLNTRGRTITAVVACAALLAALAGLSTAAGATRSGGAGSGGARITPGPSHPNIVFVLTDDMSMDLLRFMPHVLAMQRDGLTFEDYFVSDSLCCPSRSSIFTGEFPHDTGVWGNFGRQGGFRAFLRNGDERHTFALALQRAGYETAMMGKYLNGYLDGGRHHSDGARARVVRPTYIPPGWSEWDVAGWGYPEFNYRMNENGSIHRFGSRPSDYLTDVLARRGVAFIDRATADQRPFFLELATFTPHYPYVPAPQDARAFRGLRVPRPPNFDRLPTHPPRWLRGRPRLRARQIARIDKVFRLRAQDMLSVDRMIARIEATLAATGVARDTYLVFSSDNGLHTGEYRLMPGKLTAFDTDIHVPLVVVGPGVPAGARSDAMTENIDLAETFAQIGGTSVAGDGSSLLGLLHGGSPVGWRNAVLVEHHGPGLSIFDPDFQLPDSGNPPSYEAMRTRTFLYVEYADGEREFYDLRSDPFELHNLAYRLSRPEILSLHTELRALKRCHGTPACWAAMHVAAAPGL
jgi:N-acetylglucosamine-6-sulfatase